MVLIIPKTTKVIKKTQLKSIETSTQGLIRAIRIAKHEYALDNEIKNLIFTFNDGNEEANVPNLTLEYTGKKPENGTIIIDQNGKIVLALHDGKYCIEKDYESDDIIITKNKIENCNLDIQLGDSSGANHPVLLEGMTPIKWDDNNNEVNTTEDDPKWFNYGAKKWANARTADGSYWVWIPRYAYKITDGFHQTMEEGGTIDIKFLSGTEYKADGIIIETDGYNGAIKNTSNNYFLHPAFDFSNDGKSNPIPGFWVAKFEASVADKTDPCFTSPGISNCNKTTLIPKIIPNVNSWSYIQVGNMYTVSQNMKSNPIYGWNENEVDTHMMKNMEWGAVAYLSQSQYGKGTELGHNGSSFTGGTDYKTNVDQSTTGTIYGIYDMNGGKYEYVMGNYNKTNGSSGFGTNGSPSMEDIPLKYINLYSSYDDTENKYGDAIWETSSGSDGSTSWHGACSYFINSSSPWFVSGGRAGNSVAGVFSFTSYIGDGSYYHSFRPVALR